jgi:RNA polymerase sigma-70 factor, ECF subfamily
MERTDAELVDATLRGDSDAFAGIVKRYQHFVFNAIYHYLGPSADIEDVAQEVFLKLFRALDRYDTGRPLQAWIYRITVNQCFDEGRKIKHRRVKSFSEMSEEEEGRILRYHEGRQGPLSHTEAEESLRFLKSLMDGLSDKDKMAFVLREIEGLDYDEVSKAMNTSVTAARIRISRVKKRLMGQLDEKLSARKGGKR